MQILLLIVFLLICSYFGVRDASFLSRRNNQLNLGSGWFRSLDSVYSVGREKIGSWTKLIQRSLVKKPVLLLPPLGLLLLSTSVCHASPLNPQQISIRGPFFQGWLIRTIDHTNGLSVILIIGSFSSSKSPKYNQHYVFCALQHPLHSQVVEAFPSPETVHIESTTTNKPTNKGLHIRWKADGLGYFHFTDEACAGSFVFSEEGVQFSFNASARIPWSKERMSLPGPEGWLAYTNLLPCHYFIHSVGSLTDYYIKFRSTVNGTLSSQEVSGRGFSHIEGNHGTFFPKGWTWSQGIGLDNNSSFSLVSGLFEVGVLSPMTTCLYLRRSNGHCAVFRTIDLDHVKYHLDGIKRSVLIDAKSWVKGASVKVCIELTDQSAHRVHIPTAKGFSNSPGCIESYTATATIEYQDLATGNVESYEFPLTALEFGNSFVEEIHSNFHDMSQQSSS